MAARAKRKLRRTVDGRVQPSLRDEPDFLLHDDEEDIESTTEVGAMIIEEGSVPGGSWGKRCRVWNVHALKGGGGREVPP